MRPQAPPVSASPLIAAPGACRPSVSGIALGLLRLPESKKAAPQAASLLLPSYTSGFELRLMAAITGPHCRPGPRAVCGRLPGCKQFFGWVWVMRSGAVVCPASLCGIVSAAGLYGDTRTGSISGPSARRHPGSAWFSRSRLIDRLPLPLASACLHPEPAPDPIRGRLAAPRVWTPPWMQAVFRLGLGHAVRRSRVSGLSVRHCERRGPVWRYADRVHIGAKCSKAPRLGLVFPIPSH